MSDDERRSFTIALAIFAVLLAIVLLVGFVIGSLGRP